jgi:hypothetical protein
VNCIAKITMRIGTNVIVSPRLQPRPGGTGPLVNGEEWSVTAGTTCRTLPDFAAEEQICIVLQDQGPDQVWELRYRGVEMDVTLGFWAGGTPTYSVDVALKNGARAADNFGICGGGGPLTPGTRQALVFGLRVPFWASEQLRMPCLSQVAARPQTETEISDAAIAKSVLVSTPLLALAKNSRAGTIGVSTPSIHVSTQSWALATRRDTCHTAWHGNACLPTQSASTWKAPACGIAGSRAHVSCSLHFRTRFRACMPASPGAEVGQRAGRPCNSRIQVQPRNSGLRLCAHGHAHRHPDRSSDGHADSCADRASHTEPGHRVPDHKPNAHANGSPDGDADAPAHGAVTATRGENPLDLDTPT